MSSSLTSNTTYKGKIARRSWQHLPSELIRLVATHYLLDLPSYSYCPQVWEAREFWLPRIVYTVLRDALDIEKLMCICLTWSKSLETHLFWQHACAAIDPQSVLAHHAIIHPASPANTTTTGSTPSQLPYRLSPYRHFRNIINSSCHICRINSPYTSAGLGMASKRPTATPFLPYVPICKEHRKQSFCGLCLRESPRLESENDYSSVCCVENEDEETWPGVEATCRSCRMEWLWRRVASNPRDREAVGGRKWESPDWETRRRIDTFLEMGEGTIGEVVQLAQEKQWLRKFTKLTDMLSQAVAASRLASREDAVAELSYSGSEDESALDEDEDESFELMGLTEDASNVRDLAISAWARSRILDGYWTSPADQWYGHAKPSTLMRAVHPCPWNNDHDEDEEAQIEHPLQSTVQGEIPPSYQLCEQACIAYQRQMQAILLPAMKNLVRRLVIECTADGVDPTIRASRMNVEDVAKGLRDGGIWHNGVDWLERRRNETQDRDAKEHAPRTHKDKDDADDSSCSSRFEGSDSTSPVLSTSTLQTSPSPPPSEERKRGARNVAPARPRLIPVSPVLESPELIRPIPYIPVAMSQLPPNSLQTFKFVWREACAPLYHCKCSICERATSQASGGQPPPVPSDCQSPDLKPVTLPQAPFGVHVEDGQDEVDPEDVSDESSEVGEEDESGATGDEAEKLGPPWPTRHKRSSAELDDDDGEEEVDDGEEITDKRRSRGAKRARRFLTSTEICKTGTEVVLGRSGKRNSAELEDEKVITGHKRRRASVTET